MPYRAQLGGVFGSGLYPSQRQGSQAGEVIDAVTRGATTLIQGAYARAQNAREQRLQDAEVARRDRQEQRQVEQDAFNRDLATRKEARETEAQERADATAGYTRKRIEEKDVVQPGSVESNGVFGAPGKVTAPSIKKQRLTIPASLDYTKSNAYRARQQTHDIKETERGEHIMDAETIYEHNRKVAVANPMPSRAGGAAGDGRTVHAATQVRAQINEVDQKIKSLETQKTKVTPAMYKGKPVGGNPERAAELETELGTLRQRADSLRAVHDKIAGKLTDEAGIPRTIGGALKGKQGPPPAAKDRITQAEADALRKQGFSSKQIADRYTIAK